MFEGMYEPKGPPSPQNVPQCPSAPLLVLNGPQICFLLPLVLQLAAEFNPFLQEEALRGASWVRTVERGSSLKVETLKVLFYLFI